MENLLTLNYWFTLRPESLIPVAMKLFAGFIILLIAMIIITSIAKKKGKLYRRFWQKLNNFALTNFILGLVFIFFNYESIAFFSARFWLGLWVIGMIIWLVFIFINLKTIPKRKKVLDKEQEFNKYLP